VFVFVTYCNNVAHNEMHPMREVHFNEQIPVPNSMTTPDYMTWIDRVANVGVPLCYLK
jgi:hypothetical protein